MVVIDVIVWAATATEATLGVLLLTGWRPKLVGAATCLVLIVFGAAMAVSLGMESPLSCSVFSAASAAAAYAILGTTSPPHTTDTTPVKRNSERFIMKIVVIGGRGLIGSKVASKLSAQGHDVITASRRSGVDSLTGEGLADAVAGADVLVDVADSPLFDDEPVMHFFTTTTTNLLSAEQEAGVKHHVALSVVGAQIMPDSGYNTAKAAQENLIKDSGRPYSIVRATPFYEFAVGLADSATDGDIVRLPHALFRPIAADDVATAVARAAVGRPINGVTEIAGPEAMGMDDFVRTGLAANGDQRRVVTDAQAPYFGAVIDDHTLAPDENATIFTTRYSDWVDAYSSRRI
jgi:uncharacterized protein YbjT (DUF2867 family)